MPFKSEKIIIAGGKFDRRCKLTEQQKDEIISLREKISQRKCALMYGISRRTVVFLWYPDKLQRNKQVRQERGGWQQYYSKERNTETIREYRRYKQKLYVDGFIE